MFRRIAVGVGLAASALLCAPGARAQTRAQGFNLDRFQPSERGSEWFVADSLDLRGHQRFAAGLVGDYAEKPLVIYDANGNEVSPIVAHQLYAHLGGTIILWNRVRFGVNLPILLYQAGDGGTVQGQSYVSSNKTTVGDLRVGGDVRIVGQYGDPVTFAGGLWLIAPTGSRKSYTGDGAVRAIPRLMVAGDVKPFVYAAQLSFDIRAQSDTYAGKKRGSAVGIAAAAGVRVADKKLVVGPELYGSTVVTNSKAFFGRTETPFELLFGAHYTATKVWRFGAGIGPGLTRAFGTPVMRVLLSAEWVQPFEKPAPPPPPPVKPSDRDHDGVFDTDDACPDTPGVRTDDPETNGCPPPKDRDKDGVLDDDDACPDTPGVKTDDPKTNGCPPPKDSDGDGILDPDDACPDAPGPKNDDPKKNGCPVAHIEHGQIKIREQVQFAYNSAKILKTSDFILAAVKKILADHPDITKVSVEGHTDSKGSDAYNMRLSKRRAQSVVNWLVGHGVARKRLQSHGYGETRPIDTNDTEEGRANNRRVEFHIIAGAEKETAADKAAGKAPADAAAGKTNADKK
jgi:outer membrane protein OmpA-like peptidoglycan-associated protein